MGMCGDFICAMLRNTSSSLLGSLTCIFNLSLTQQKVHRCRKMFLVRRAKLPKVVLHMWPIRGVWGHAPPGNF